MPIRSPALPLAAAVVTLAVAGCGGSADPPGPTPTGAALPAPANAAIRADLAARAAAAQDRSAVSFYLFRTPSGDERTVMVVRAPDGSWRVDIAGAALSGRVDVAMVGRPDGLFHCALAGAAGQAGCVPVTRLTDDIDPQVQHVFTDWLGVLTDRTAALAVAPADQPEAGRAPGRESTPPRAGTPSPAAPASAGPSGDADRSSASAQPAGPAAVACFAVESSAASLLAPLSTGVYCFAENGTLTVADLELGTLTLVSSDPETPETVELPGPVVDGQPLPRAAPTPSPTATTAR